MSVSVVQVSQPARLSAQALHPELGAGIPALSLPHCVAQVRALHSLGLSFHLNSEDNTICLHQESM